MAASATAPPKSPANNRWLAWVVPPVLVGATAIIAELAKEPRGKPTARPDNRPNAAPGSLGDLIPGLGEIQGRKDPRGKAIATAEATPPPAAPAAPAPAPAAPPAPVAAGGQKGGIGEVQPLPELSSTANPANEARVFALDPGPGQARAATAQRPNQAEAAPREADRVPASFRAEIASLLKNRSQRGEKELAESIQAILKAHESPQTTEMANQLSELTSRAGHLALDKRVRILRKRQIPETYIFKHIAKDEAQHIHSRNGPQSVEEVWIHAAQKLIRLQ